MKISLRAKILSLASLAGILSLLAAVTVIWTIGYRQRVSEQGSRFQNEAAHVANILNLRVGQEIEDLDNLLVLGNIAPELARIAPGSNPGVNVAELDKAWAGMPVSAPEISPILNNDLAITLRRFQSVNPAVAEIGVTDERGRLIAATGKTTDYDQSDEAWWQQAMRLRGSKALLTGLAFDESAGVFSLDISIPVPSTNPGTPAGVMKAVLNISPIFGSIPVFSPKSGVTSEVVEPDGNVLLRPSKNSIVPSDDKILASAATRLRASESGWFIGPLREDTPSSMTGFAAIHLSGVVAPDGSIDGPDLYIVIEQPSQAVLAPVLQRSLLTLALGSIFIIGTILTGIWFIQRNLLSPIDILRRAAATITTTASRSTAEAAPLLQDSLRQVSSIRTGDEVQELAQDFSTMAGRLLNYQSDLKREIGAKTAEIQRDLDLARDFQNAFLPHSYPRVASTGAPGSLTLNFCHIYQAASTVGGDFLDVVQLNDHCAGVLIADVMGHGTRSALVTAILRTILHGLATRTEDPAHFLSLLNHRFHDILKETDEIIFVSVCYVILDTRAQTVRCASAGHPSPLIANRRTRQLTALFDALRNNPALGLYAESRYDVFTQPLHEGDILLLFTDGVIEALNATDEEFGIARLVNAVRENLDADLPLFTKSLLDRVLAFTGPQPPTDDICLLAAEAAATVRVRASVAEPR